MINRNLDGNYFYVDRDNNNVQVCFSDMTREEQNMIIDNLTVDKLKLLCLNLADSLEFIGNFYNIKTEDN